VSDYEPKIVAVRHLATMPQRALALNTSASQLQLTIDVCGPALSTPPTVVESNSEVRISVDLRVKTGGDNASCAAGTLVTLRSPLGERRVIDGHSGHEVEVILTNTTDSTGLCTSADQRGPRCGCAIAEGRERRSLPFRA
jgi:hypothetical protein